MMSGCKRTALMPRHTSYDALYVNPDHNSSSIALSNSNNQDKENSTPNNNNNDDVNSDKENNLLLLKKHKDLNNNNINKSYKLSSLQLCMERTEPDKELSGGSSGDLWDPPSVASSDNSSSLKIWDYSDSEAAPASSWSTLPNKSLLCRPLPMDVGRCTCVIVKEKSPPDGGYLFSLYTNEGKGRQDRKLAIARHKRRNGRSELTIAQNMKGISSHSDDSFIGVVSANLIGSKYQIWDQGKRPDCLSKPSKSLLAAVSFTPTVSTWTGRYRRIRAYVPKHQSMQLKNTAQVQHIKGLPTDWEGNMEKIHQLYSKIPAYNKLSKQYELDFRDRGRAGLRIQSSVKNFQLTLEENGKQTILQLGRVGKAKYVMDYRYPLTGYQAFCICLASIDSKLCCAV